MIRYLAALIILVAISATAYADTGKQADMTITIDMSKMAEAFGALGTMFGEEAEPVEASPPEIISIGGKMFWTRDAMLVEMEAEGEKMQTLVDYQSMVSYQLDPQSKKAYYTDLKSFQESFTNEQGLMPGFEFMFNELDTTLDGLASIPGAAVAELAPKMVNGVNCKGASFTITPPEPEDEAEPTGDAQADMLSSMLGNMGPMSGEVWYSEELELPLKFSISMFMMDVTMDLANVIDWEADPAMLSVPDEFELVEMNPMKMYEEMAEPTEATP